MINKSNDNIPIKRIIISCPGISGDMIEELKREFMYAGIKAFIFGGNIEVTQLD